MAKKPKDQTKKKSNPILWFLFAIVVPLIVAITITIIIFSVAGFNVIDFVKNTGNNIPVISSVIKTDKEKTDQRTEETYKGKIAKKEEEIEKLETEVANLESTVDELEQEIVKLENRDEPTENNEQAETQEDKEKNSQLTSMIASYEQMDPEQTALILQDLEEGVAIAILKGLSEDVRAGVFEALDPEKAAQYTKAYIDSRE